jgi:hypothetical protein
MSSSFEIDLALPRSSKPCDEFMKIAMKLENSCNGKKNSRLFFVLADRP